MSIVRYTNKKTGVVSLYESTSYYDPELKQSRPKRKYLGIEDPETGELIPSSGKRGRKKADGSAASSGNKRSDDILQADCDEKAARIKQLEHENRKLRFCLKNLRDSVDAMISDMEQ